MKPLETIARAFMEHDPGSAARALETLPVDEVAALLRDLPAKVGGAVIEHLLAHSAGPILAEVGPEHTARLLASVPLKRVAAALRQTPTEQREPMLVQMEEKRADAVRRLLTHEVGTAGAMMDPQVTTIPLDATAQRAISVIRKAKPQTLHYLYVTDREGRLVGVLTLRALLLASPRDPVEPLVIKQVKTLRPDETRAKAVEALTQARLLALPVVDAEEHLLGVVRQRDAADVAREQAFGDLQKMAGAGADEHALSPVSTVVARRLPWLLVNLATAFAAAAVVGVFEGTIERVTALAILLPVVAGQGGNTGAQALAVVMRGLALNEIAPGSTPRLMLKEMMGGAINGLAIALVTGVAVFVWDGRWALSAVIAAAMVVNMAAAGLSGAIIPILLRALGRDPAQSSSIFLTTVTDCVGFAAFLGFAVAFMPWLDPV